LKLCALT